MFVSHTKEDAECAEHIHQVLEAKGYTTWCESAALTMESILYPRTIENVILSSAAIILVWSRNSSAAQSEWIERYILFAQRLKKLILPVVIDGAALPNSLVSVTLIMGHNSCNDVVAQLLPLLPPPDSTDPLIKLSERAAHAFIRIRKEAIDQAAEMLLRGEHREDVLGILEYLARNDQMMGVRDKAQEVLDADAKKVAPPPPSSQSRHIFGARCRNGHITYYDKRKVCPVSSMVVRDIVERAGKKLDDLYLKCGQCNEEMVVRVDCEGYK